MPSSPRRWLLGLSLVAAAGAAGLIMAGQFSPTPTASEQSPTAPADEQRSAPASAPAQPWVPAPAPPVAVVPDEVATDAPVTVAAGEEVTVQVSAAEWNSSTSAVEVYGLVPSVAESDGTCTATLTRGSVSVTASAGGIANGQSTACGELQVPRQQLSPGSWGVVLSYRSGQYQGTSAGTTVAVP